ncbi:Uncharacterized conserved protein [Ceraceosorus bombacis]|uniref:Uncharacterized conserved protein n=1 Tax=Ceraceosorus bombacis TaxID=401625 RepID=A0A0P1BP32_9BASI|nr:Uncharacterized conserved protein [Ceraceosorus bombacis]
MARRDAAPSLQEGASAQASLAAVDDAEEGDLGQSRSSTPSRHSASLQNASAHMVRALPPSAGAGPPASQSLSSSERAASASQWMYNQRVPQHLPSSSSSSNLFSPGSHTPTSTGSTAVASRGAERRTSAGGGDLASLAAGDTLPQMGMMGGSETYSEAASPPAPEYGVAVSTKTSLLVPQDGLTTGAKVRRHNQTSEQSTSTSRRRQTDPESPSGPVGGPSELRREALQRWVLSVGCVNFDLDRGPDLEFLYPPLGISREERDNIAFSSFPDTSIFDDGYCVFSWRVREVPLSSSGSEPPAIASSAAGKSSTLPSRQNSSRRVSYTNASSSGGSTMNRSGSKGQRSLLGAHLFGHHANASSSSTSVALTDPMASVSSASRDGSKTDILRSLARGVSSAKKDAADHSAGASTSSSRSASPMPSPSRSSVFAFGSSKQADQCLEAAGGESISSQEASASRVAATDSSSATGYQLLCTDVDAQQDGTVARLSAEEERRLEREASATLHDHNSSATAPQQINAPARKSSSQSVSYIYGYVFFRQRRDAAIRRGYFQKSLVILSHLPYVSLFSRLVAKLGPLYFEHGMPMLESFCHEVANWPSPEAGSTLSLPVLGTVLSAALPLGYQTQTSNAAQACLPPATSAAGKANSVLIRKKRRSRGGTADGEDENDPLLASIPSNPLFAVLRDTISDLWLVWECMLLAEPLLVVGPDPKQCSEAVWHLLDMIRPVPFGGDWRPFFTIHDYDFKTLITRNKPLAGTILGVTNPFMLQVCSHWPHTLRVGKAAPKPARHLSTSSVNRKPSSGAGPSGTAASTSSGAGGGIAGGNSAGGGGPEHIPGFTSKRKRRISKDRPLLRRLLEMAERRDDDEAANAMLRRYFSDLTERFLAPLNRYVSSLIPAGFNLSSPAEAPKIKPFSETDFLASLRAHGTPLPIRSRSLPTGNAVRQSLYLDFLRCPNFGLWLHDKIVAAQEEQWRRRVAILEEGDVLSYARDHGEVETLDLWARLVEEIRSLDAKISAPPEPGPGSRWRVDTPATSAARGGAKDSTDGAARIAAVNLSQHAAPVLPTNRSIAHAHVRGASVSTINSGTSTGATDGQGRGSLLARRARLCAQLDKLGQTLSDDLKGSLRLS